MPDLDPNVDVTSIINEARSRLDTAFQNANEARDLLAELSLDPRFQTTEMVDVLEKVIAARSAVDLVLVHT